MSKDHDDETDCVYATYARESITAMAAVVKEAEAMAADYYDDYDDEDDDGLNDDIKDDICLACDALPRYMYNGLEERGKEKCEETRGALDASWDRTLTAARAALDRLDVDVKRVQKDQDEALAAYIRAQDDE